MKKIVTIIGARPQIIKASALSRMIEKNYKDSIREVIIHTGQHYDFKMSEVFISELGIPQSAYNLQAGSATHGEQTADMIRGIEQVLLKEKPEICVVYGDTNSTLAGAVAASKLQIPLAHIEAGMRSYDKTMPEELNRITSDHFSTLLFAATDTAVRNLIKEGFKTSTEKPFSINNPAVIFSGDVMYDNILHFSELATQKSKILQTLDLAESEFALCTVHRANNTDNPERLADIFRAISELSMLTNLRYVVPLHPRTLKMLEYLSEGRVLNPLKKQTNLQIIEPVSYLDMILLESRAKLILTDSGGVQKEAFFLNKPCIIFRNETEWPEIIEQNAGILVDANVENIKNGVIKILKKPDVHFQELFGKGNAAEIICQHLKDF